MVQYRPIGEPPYGVSGPVSDAAMWFGRDELLAFLREELVRPPEIGGAALVVVWGARGMGKSSLLARIAAGGPGLELDAGAMDLLVRHPWPGNVRELKNIMEHALIKSGDDVILPGHLHLLDEGEASIPPAGLSEIDILTRTTADFEQSSINQRLIAG